MSTRLKEKLDIIQQIMTELAEDSVIGIPIVVEGKKDVDTVRSLGVTGLVLKAKAGGKSFAQVLQEIEETGAHEVILLLDLDRRGKQGTKTLKDELERKRIKVNFSFWHAISALAGREIHCIESLASYLDTLQQKTT